MKALLCACLLATSATSAAEPPPALAESFDSPLSADWFWGLGTWTAKDGILRGFESGPRRHGPVKMRHFPLRDGTLECEFRLEGKATFAGIIFNGTQERGHLVHLVMGKDQCRILAHPPKGENVEAAKEAHPVSIGDWHRVKIIFKGPTMTATIDDATITATLPCIGEKKLTFGLGGDSGGPEGETAGALSFRHLTVRPSR